MQLAVHSAVNDDLLQYYYVLLLVISGYKAQLDIEAAYERYSGHVVRS
jgi:hypothetical protein